MNAIPNDDSPNVSMALDHVIRAHGFLAVMVALVMRPLRRSQDTRPAGLAGMSDHMLRDIGQEPGADMQPVPQHLLHMAMILRSTR
jgi:uncharacterized protein YjiS (DUF1127 family)